MTPLLPTIESCLEKRPALRWLGLWVVILVGLSTLALPVVRMNFEFSIDYNEGGNVYQSVQAVTEGVLYDDETNAWTPNNYPPLSFFIVGAAGTLLNDQLLAGRLIALLSLLFVCLAVAIVVAKVGGQRYEAVYCAFLCLGFFTIHARNYVAMHDPQLLGHMFQMCGLLVYLQNRTSRLHLFMAAALLSVGLFTKHNLVALPLAMSLDVLLRSRKDFIRTTVYLSIVAGSLTIATQLMVGEGFVRQLLGVEGSRGYSHVKSLAMASALAWGLHVNVLAVLPAVFVGFRREGMRVVSLYFVTAAITGVYAAGGHGVDVNTFFDLYISIALSTGALFIYLRSRARMRRGYPGLVCCVVALILSLGLLLASPGRVFRPGTWTRFENRERMFLDDAAFVSSMTGPAMCEDALLCYYAGKRFEYDPFNMAELVLSGRVAEGKVVERFQSGYFTVIQLKEESRGISQGAAYGPTKRSGRFTRNSKIAIAREYGLARRASPRAFYVRRGSR